jgi:hypothetical protein
MPGCPRRLVEISLYSDVIDADFRRVIDFHKFFAAVNMNKTWLTAIMLIGCVSLYGQTPDTKTTPTSAPPLKVTILGSGGGPPVNLQRFGPSILVETSVGDKLLFDCGRGFAERLAEYGVSLGAVDKLFLTHLAVIAKNRLTDRREIVILRRRHRKPGSFESGQRLRGRLPPLGPSSNSLRLQFDTGSAPTPHARVR